MMEVREADILSGVYFIRVDPFAKFRDPELLPWRLMTVYLAVWLGEGGTFNLTVSRR